jgi:hypothetical protein
MIMVNLDLRHALGVAHAADAKVAQEWLGGDVGQRRLVEQVMLLELVAQVEDDVQLRCAGVSGETGADDDSFPCHQAPPVCWQVSRACAV